MTNTSGTCSRVPEPSNSIQRAKVDQKKDNEKLNQLQTDYIFLRMWNQHSNSQTEKDFIKTMQTVAKKFIFYEQNKKRFFISPDDIEFKSLGAVAYIMHQFQTRPDFRLKIPSQYIRLRVLHELYYHKKIEEFISYTDEQLEYYAEGRRKPHGDLTTMQNIQNGGSDD